METWITSAAVACALTASVLGGPPSTGGPVGARAAPVATPGDGPGWSENFDSYPAGSPLSGQGGWAPWCLGGSDGTVSTEHAASAPNSFRATIATDMVQTFAGATSGKWVFKVRTYVPAAATGSAFVIVLNRYCASANNDWSITCELSATTGLAGVYVNGLPNGAVLPLVRDQWVEYRAEIDLAADTLKEYYNGQLFTTIPQTWTGNVQAGGQLAVAALDLYSSTMDGAFYDDASLAPVVSCYPDCNGDGALNLADFGCFQTKFALGDPYADCNGDGVRNLSDFGCFQTKFALGCP